MLKRVDIKLNYKPLTNVEFKVEMLDEVKRSPETEKFSPNEISIAWVISFFYLHI